MSAALKTAEISPEALAFVSRGTPKPAYTTPVEEELPPAAAQPVISPARQSSVETEPTPQRSRTTAKSAPVASGAVVGLSFRLPAEIHNALMRASFERKMEKIEPWTQQEIAAEAFSAWLKKHGYL